MKVKALIGFVATIDGVKYRAAEGDELEMPDKANWVNEKLAEALEPVELDLETMNVTELQARAKELGVVYSGLKKAELIQALTEAENGS